MSISPQSLPTSNIPSHVSAELVRSSTIFTVPGPSADPFQEVCELHQGPRAFFNAIASPGRPSGAWTFTRAKDIRHILQNPQIFSSERCAGFSALVGESWSLIPLELDPPSHTAFRAVMNPWLAPAAVGRLEERMRARARELIAPLLEQRSCEFIEAFARPFPVSIFMELMGLPHSEMKTFLAWEERLLHDPDLAVKAVAARDILDYLRDLIAARRRNPVDDLTSRAVTAKIEDRSLSDDEVMGMCYLLFVGGLDTVAASLGFYFHHLATHPQAQQRLRSEPAVINPALEEYLRRFSVVTTTRHVTQDTELGGIALRGGDRISVNYALGSLDPEEFAEPLKVSFDRKGVRHFGFAFGPHFCLGVHLARREMRVALEEWMQCFPTLRLDPAGQVLMHGGGVFGVDRLDLTWP